MVQALQPALEVDHRARFSTHALAGRRTVACVVVLFGRMSSATIASSFASSSSVSPVSSDPRERDHDLDRTVTHTLDEFFSRLQACRGRPSIFAPVVLGLRSAAIQQAVRRAGARKNVVLFCRS